MASGFRCAVFHPFACGDGTPSAIVARMGLAVMTYSAVVAVVFAPIVIAVLVLASYSIRGRSRRSGPPG